ncbi:MAG: efflux RND transporter permease subunit [Limisphaerales bacterium]
MSEPPKSGLGRFATDNALAITFIAAVLCLAGLYSILRTPSSVFPQTNFPRIAILVDNGIMPADEMMATITRPIEEAMKDIPGTVTIRSATSRGAAQINVFFNWQVNMVQSELYALGRLAEIRSDLPATAVTTVSRVTFSVFPIIGISLTSPTRDLMSLWDTAEYDLKPRFLQIPGVSRVELVGGKEPEYHVIIDPLNLQSAQLSVSEITDALLSNNLVAPAGMLEENFHLYLTTVDGRAHSAADLENLIISAKGDHPVRLKDVASVERGPKPVFTVVTAQGRNAVLLNIESQPDGSTLDIAAALRARLKELKRTLPPDMRLDFFYDQSQFVRESVGSVRDAILFGLLLSLVILYFFLKSWGSVFIVILTIPITVLITSVSMGLLHMTFNMMTLGGIAASIGLIIDDAIVVVEAIYAKTAAGHSRLEAIHEAMGEILHPLIASTLTPVVVFIPLAFLSGITGVFFRALAMTMVVSLLTSLVLAVTLTPSLAGWLVRQQKQVDQSRVEGGFLLRRVLRVYEWAVRQALRFRWITLLACGLVAALGVVIYQNLKTDFLPEFDEGGFVIDFNAPPGTSLTETSRILDQAETMIRGDPDVEGYSRRLGTQLGLFITEPYRGDFLVKLKPDRKRATEEVIADFRHQFNQKFPMVRWDFPGILSDLIGDLQLEPDPIGIKLFSPDLEWLKKTAPRVEEEIKSVPGVVDTFDGLTETGPSVSLRVRQAEAGRFGLTASDIGDAVHTAMLGQVSSYVLQGERILDIRVMQRPKSFNSTAALRELAVRTPSGALVKLSQVADIEQEPSQVELDREDLRQNVVISGRLEGRDLGSAMKEIQSKLAQANWLPTGVLQYGGLYQQQQESFRNLLFVLLMALLLVFTVLVIEFKSFYEPVSIVFGAVLSMFGTVAALWLTGTTLNIVSFLGAIIGVGIVAKNGILMLDLVDHLRAQGMGLEDALLHSGHRRLRPVLMTSLAAALGMLPLAFGIGSGADMLRPLAIAMIGALCISVLLSLVATPTLYYLMRRLLGRKQPETPPTRPLV